MGTANEAGAGDLAREADGSLPKAGAKRKGAPGKKTGAPKSNPRKRARTNPSAPSGIGNTGNDTPSVPPFPTFNAPPIAQDYSHLPPPSIPGGVPIDVPYHPDILVRHDEQPTPSSTTAGDGGIQNATPVDGADRNAHAQMTYVQPPPHSLPNTRATSGASTQPQSYAGQWAQVPQPQLHAPGQPFPPHSQLPPHVIGTPSYAYSTQQAAMDTMPSSHVSASHPMQPYPHVPIPLRPTEYTQPPSASANPMRPSQFPSGPISSPQSFIPPPQGGLDYRHRSHSHTQQAPLIHSHQRVSSFGQPGQPPQVYGTYQAQAPYSQSHSGYSMSSAGMSGPPSTLTSPSTHEDMSTLTPSRSTTLPSSAAYLPLSSAALESSYRPPHPHGGGGAYPPGPGPSPSEAALQGHAYATQQTGYEGYCTWSIFPGRG